MPGLKKSSQSDWNRVRRECAEDAPIPYDPETDLYDPNDPAQVASFFATAMVKRRPGRPKGEATKLLTPIRFDVDIITAFKATGKGWQTRMNDALREWLQEHPLKPA